MCLLDPGLLGELCTFYLHLPPIVFLHSIPEFFMGFLPSRKDGVPWGRERAGTGFAGYCSDAMISKLFFANGQHMLVN